MILIRFCIFLMLILGPITAVTAQNYRTPEELADENGAFINIGGEAIYYVAEGNPTDPALIFIHGFGGSTFTWRDILGPVAAQGFYAVALDLPPFGLSTKNPALDYSRSAMADLVAAFMDELGIASATIVGHSMGGAVTAQFAVRHSERVEKLIFVAGGIFSASTSAASDADSSAGRSNPFSLLQRIDPRSPLATAALRALVNRDFFRDTLISAYYDDTLVTEEAVDGYARLLLIEDAPAGFLAYTVARDTDPVTLEDLSESATEIPVLIVWGEEDTWVPITVGETMAQTLQNVEFIHYPAIGHLPMEENTEAFIEDLLRFLQS